MSEAALLSLIVRYPHPVAIARRVGAPGLQLGVQRLEQRGLLARRDGLYRVTERGHSALAFRRGLQAALERAQRGGVTG